MPNITEILKRPFGEMNMLRGIFRGSLVPSYTLDSSKVDYNLARQLYKNEHNKYKLGAWGAKPIINTTAGFMGAPNFSHPNPEADQFLEQTMKSWRGKIAKGQRNSLREGDAYARILYVQSRLDPSKKEFKLALIPPERVTVILDPISGGMQTTIIRHPVELHDADGRKTGSTTIVETITKDLITIKVDGQKPTGVQISEGSTANPWGMIPIIHLKNEGEEHQLNGSSELESAEPFFKAYHDTMMSAIQGSKMFSKPKTIIATANIQTFLANNFTPEEIKNKKLNFAGRDVYIGGTGDSMQLITAQSGIEGSATLLELLFLCIVQVSETPEFALGGAVSSSKASVSEQMVPLAKKIERKRDLFYEPHTELAGMLLAMAAKVENMKLETYQVDVNWDEISQRDDKNVADTIHILVQGLIEAVDGGLMAHSSASEFLRQFVPTMLPYLDKENDQDELRRIAQDQEAMNRVREGGGLDPNKDPNLDDNQDDDEGAA